MEPSDEAEASFCGVGAAVESRLSPIVTCRLYLNIIQVGIGLYRWSTEAEHSFCSENTPQMVYVE